jgi:hypothetical protein
MGNSVQRRAIIIDEEQQKNMLKIGDVSKLSGIGIEALRFYEALPPSMLSFNVANIALV